MEWDTLCFFNGSDLRSYAPDKLMNVDINEKRLCKLLLLLWFAVFVAFLVFGSIASLLGIDLEESDKPNKTVPICGTPWVLEHLNQAAVTGDLRE